MTQITIHKNEEGIITEKMFIINKHLNYKIYFIASLTNACCLGYRLSMTRCTFYFPDIIPVVPFSSFNVIHISIKILRRLFQTYQ